MTSIVKKESLACKFIVSAISISLCLGCTSMQVVSGTSKEALTGQLSVGDRVEITRNSGGTDKFSVTEISDTGISGDGKFVAYDDILQVKVSESPTSGGTQTSTSILIGIAVVAGLLLLINAGLQGAAVPPAP